MRAFMASVGAIALQAFVPTIANAASLAVSPTTIDMAAPQAASELTLRNDDAKPLTVQLRVFRWVQENGKDKLVATSDVVASPPYAKLAPGGDYVVRIVRASKAPVQGEESYRVLVDQVPVKSDMKPGTVNFVIRQSIPIFFRADSTAADIAWTASKGSGGLMLSAHNNGAGRMKLSDITLSQNGKVVATKKGLVGYVLGGSTMSFSLGGKGISASQLILKANGTNGPITAKVSAR